MPQPAPRDVYVDEFLTNVLIAYAQEESNFVSTSLFPVVPVQLQSSILPKYDRADWYRSEAMERGPASESAGTGWDVDKSIVYNCKQYSLHKDLDPRTLANQQDPLDLEAHAVRFLAQQMMIQRDREWASTYFTAGVWGNELTGVAAAPGAGQFLQWDQVGSTPIEDVTSAMVDAQAKTGFKPVKAVVDPRTFQILRNHPDVQDRIKFSERGIVTEEILAALLGLQELKVAVAVQNSAAEGAAESTDFIVGKGMLLVWTPPSPAILVPSAGYTLAWTGLLGGEAFAGQVSRHDMPLRNRSTRVEVDMAYDMLAVETDLGLFLADPIA